MYKSLDNKLLNWRLCKQIKLTVNWKWDALKCQTHHIQTVVPHVKKFTIIVKFY